MNIYNLTAERQNLLDEIKQLSTEKISIWYLICHFIIEIIHERYFPAFHNKHKFHQYEVHFLIHISYIYFPDNKLIFFQLLRHCGLNPDTVLLEALIPAETSLYFRRPLMLKQTCIKLKEDQY